MYIIINKIYENLKYDYKMNKVIQTENDNDYIVAPVMIKSEDIIRIYTKLPDFTDLVFDIYNHKHNTYDTAVERFKGRVELLGRLDELKTLLNKE